MFVIFGGRSSIHSPSKFQMTTTTTSSITTLFQSIKHLSTNGQLSQAFTTFSLLLHHHHHHHHHHQQQPPPHILIPPLSSLLSSSISLSLSPQTKQLHSIIFSLGLLPHPSFNPLLTSFYSHLSQLSDASHIAYLSHQAFSYNVVISSYINNNFSKNALKVYRRMLEHRVEPDSFTYPSILKACAQTKDLALGKEVHKGYLDSGLGWNLLIYNALVAMYAKCGELVVARKVFDEMGERDVVSWNTIINGYATGGYWEEAFGMFERMRGEGVEVNAVAWNTVINGKLMMGCFREALGLVSEMRCGGGEFDFVTVVVGLNACSRFGSVRLGKEIHGLAIRTFWDGSESVTNALITMYSRCWKIEVAHIVFQRARNVSLITWNCMLTGFTINDQAQEASMVFRDCIQCGHRPNYVTTVTILSLCARLANLQHGRELHCFITKKPEFKEYRLLWNSLVDMYSKSGKISTAQNVFDTMTDRDQVSYTSLITGYGVQGEGTKALQLFNEMISSGIEPDNITMVAILSACSHSRLVAKGQHIFDSMVKSYGIKPKMEHYSCMVDLYARAGLLENAEELLNKMPIRPTAAVWASLLGACLVYRNTEIGQRAAKKLLEMRTQNGGHYVLIANMYAAIGLWEELAKVRLIMRNMGVRKAPGCAWADLGNGFQPFLVEDRSSPLAPEIYTALEGLYEQMRDVGCVDIEEEVLSIDCL